MSSLNISENYKMHTDAMSKNLKALLDSQTFTEFRDYYLRIGMFDTELRFFDKKDGLYVKEHLNDPIITQIEKKDIKDYVESLAVICQATRNTEFKITLELEIKHILQNNTTTPYEKVGKVLDHIKQQRKHGIKIEHHEYLRDLMERMLLDWMFNDLKKKENEPVICNGLDSCLINIIKTKQKSQAPYTWKSLWSMARNHNNQSRYNTTTSAYMKNKKAYTHSLRKSFSYGELLITSKLFRHGYMYNRLSYARIQEFIERQYILTSTEKTFDKKFLAEWLSGYNWTSQEHKNKYESLKTECVKKWAIMIFELVKEEIEFLVPLIITKNKFSDTGRAHYNTTLDQYSNTTSAIEKPRVTFLDKNQLQEIIINNPICIMYKSLLNIPGLNVEELIQENFPEIKNIIKSINVCMNIPDFEHRYELTAIIDSIKKDNSGKLKLEQLEFIV